MDLLDRQLIHSLQIDPRISFSRAAEVLGVSEQTVARRYRRLRGDGVVRVIGVVDPRRIGQSDWVIRVQVRPDGTARLAAALTRRDDVAWVSVSSGGSEIIGSVRSRTREQRDDLLSQRLPRTAPVLGMAAYVILHHFRARSEPKLINIGEVLSAQQVDALRPAVSQDSEPATLTAADEPLLAVLAGDGRASLAQLARACGQSEGRTARRLAALRDSGALYFDVDLATGLLGLGTAAHLWLTVVPHRLAAVGDQLAALPEVEFIAAVTGAANLFASVVCRDLDALYDLITNDLGVIDGVVALEVSPVSHRLKQSGALMDGDRLAHPAPRRAPAR
ncbi:Lrp/AsnC family transcriptional regulator [Rugosimonospora acidiphila]|uniref:Lrp/AsnC family transcriptional regulator n=1 Tax=Rugosimonospora acidiphila TaxID=556531 RepID=A0ABP9SS95_9ACTN